MSVDALPLTPDRTREHIAAVARVAVPILLALAVGGAILLILGKNPFTYYGYVVQRGLLSWGGNNPWK